MSELYPLKFEPVLKETIWGGTSLVNRYNKNANPDLKYGESWELSAVSLVGFRQHKKWLHQATKSTLL